jgi:hypothetical protein
MFIYDDSFLTEEEITKVDDLFHSFGIRWAYFKTTQNNDVNHPGVVNTRKKDVPYFSAGISEDSQEYLGFKFIIDKFCLKHGLEYSSLGRVKLNVTPHTYEEGTLYPHVDKNEPHLIFLYYVHDSDGDTVLYNETFNGVFVEPPLTVMHSITPKRGAAFVVDGRHFHSITPPSKHSVRSVINANLNLNSY